jgi:hypothetical protein
MGYGLQRGSGICSTAKSMGGTSKQSFRARAAGGPPVPFPKGCREAASARGELHDGAYQYRVEHRVAAERWSRHAAALRGRHALLPRWEHDGVWFAPRVN